jgi:hypothetical protein
MAYSTGTKSSAAFTPAASAHGARDVLGTAQEFKLLGTGPGESIIINTSEILIAGATAVTTIWEVHLFSVTPPSAQADDAVFNLPAGDLSAYLGFVPIAQTVDYVDNQYGHTLNVGKQVKLTGTSVFGVLVPVSAITTQAVAHTVTLHATIAV